ncbi:hypothetical protein [Stenotrophomonas sp. Iso1]|uniref:hypothetical protein n=1 Tax=Stenotrophomonas sp. Iso1 TaxID=2977283 RepID=UPI0022B7CBDC|nr:hypothetical protein [Stenotrophomonas sp. Iso1]
MESDADIRTNPFRLMMNARQLLKPLKYQRAESCRNRAEKHVVASLLCRVASYLRGGVCVFSTFKHVAIRTTTTSVLQMIRRTALVLAVALTRFSSWLTGGGETNAARSEGQVEAMSVVC